MPHAACSRTANFNKLPAKKWQVPANPNHKLRRHLPYDARLINLAVVQLCHQFVIKLYDRFSQRFAVALFCLGHAF